MSVEYAAKIANYVPQYRWKLGVREWHVLYQRDTGLINILQKN